MAASIALSTDDSGRAEPRTGSQGKFPPPVLSGSANGSGQFIELPWKAISLAELATRFPGSLPQLVKVDGVYSDLATGAQVRDGDILKVLRLKDAPVVEARDYNGTTVIKIPATARTNLSILHIPKDDFWQGMKGTTYPRVSAICAAAEMPQAVCVLQPWRKKTCFIDKHDILVVKGKSRQKTKTGLTVFSMKYRTTMFLPESCKGMFSTAPELTEMPLSDILTCASELLPICVYSSALKTCLKLTRKGNEPTFTFAKVDGQVQVEFHVPMSNTSLRVTTVQTPDMPSSLSAGLCPPSTGLSQTPKQNVLSEKYIEQEKIVAATVAEKHMSNLSYVKFQSPLAHAPNPTEQSSNSTIDAKIPSKTPPSIPPKPCIDGGGWVPRTRKKPSSSSLQEDNKTNDACQDSVVHDASKSHPTKSENMTTDDSTTGNASSQKPDISATSSKDKDSTTLGTGERSPPPQTQDDEHDANVLSSLLGTSTDGGARVEEDDAPPPLPPPYNPMCENSEEESDEEGDLEPYQAEKYVPPPPPAGYEATSDPISLQDLLRLRSQDLPVDVLVQDRVTKRLPCGPSFTVRCVRYVEVAAAETLGGDIVDIPLNTSMSFSLLYDPLDDTRSAVRGFVFKSVARLLFINPRPKLVGCKQRWEGGGVDLEPDELLAIDPCQKDTNSMSVYSLLTKARKVIPADCAAAFTTGAIHLCMSLSDIAAYIPHAFPAKVCILRNDRGPKCYGANVLCVRNLTIGSVVQLEPLDRSGSESEQPLRFLVPLNLPNLSLVTIARSQSAPLPSGEAACDHVCRPTKSKSAISSLPDRALSMTGLPRKISSRDPSCAFTTLPLMLSPTERKWPTEQTILHSDACWTDDDNDATEGSSNVCTSKGKRRSDLVPAALKKGEGVPQESSSESGRNKAQVKAGVYTPLEISTSVDTQRYNLAIPGERHLVPKPQTTKPKPLPPRAIMRKTLPEQTSLLDGPVRGSSGSRNEEEGYVDMAAGCSPVLDATASLANASSTASEAFTKVATPPLGSKPHKAEKCYVRLKNLDELHDYTKPISWRSCEELSSLPSHR